MIFYWEVLSQAGLSVKEHEPLMFWAFGPKWKSLSGRKCREQWNERHGSLFTVKGNDPILNTMLRIADAFKNREEESSCQETTNAEAQS